MEEKSPKSEHKARKKFLRNKKFTFIIALIVLVVALIGTIFLVNNRQEASAKALEKEMTNLTSRYFDEFIRSKVIGINKQIITIDTLEKANYDISKLKDPYTGQTCDKENSFSYIIINDPAETDYDKISYTVENHLKCGDYNSENGS